MKKVLFFYKGLAPTAEERAAAEKAGAVLRSRSAWHEGDFPEPCTAVMGDYPPCYADKAGKSAPAKEGEDTAEGAQEKNAPKKRDKKSPA